MSRRSADWILLVASFLLVACAQPAMAGDYELVTELSPTVPLADGEFGRGLAADGDVVVVGAPDETLAGVAYVMRFDGTTWVEEQRLTASDGADFDEFGAHIAIDGDVILIGATSHDGLRGAVYVYRYDGSSWAEVQKLTAAGGVSGDQLGTGLAIEGDVALVGASGYEDNRGAVYSFRYDGSVWVEEQKLVASDGAEDDSFGQSTALQGGTALIGAFGDDTFRGSAYTFEYDGSSWIEGQKLVVSGLEVNDSFGVSVDLDGNAALIGAYRTSATTQGSEGAAYVFRHDGTQWVEEQKLLPADLTGVRLFGLDLALEGDTALIGAPLSDESETFQGAAYIFHYDGSSWEEDSPRLIAPDADVNDSFGLSVALESPFAFVGCHRDDDVEPESGSVYVFGTLPCVDGTVNAGNGLTLDVLGVNGLTGGADRTVQLQDDAFFEILVARPVSGGNGRFVLHADVGAPGITAQRFLPFDIGLTCFPFLLSDGAAPVIVANCIGRENRVGESSFLGSPATDPDPATTSFLYPPLPLGTVLTFQGVILDPASVSSKSASTTNAVIVEVVP